MPKNDPDALHTATEYESPAPTSLPRLLTADEVAPYLRVPTARVYEMARLDLIPAIRMKRQVRFLEAALLDWLKRGGTP